MSIKERRFLLLTRARLATLASNAQRRDLLACLGTEYPNMQQRSQSPRVYYVIFFSVWVGRKSALSVDGRKLVWAFRNP